MLYYTDNRIKGRNYMFIWIYAEKGLWQVQNPFMI